MSSHLPSGTSLKEGQYCIKALHTLGGQALVYEGVEVASGKQIIIKQTYKEQIWSHQVLWEEASLLSSISHQAIPRVLDCFNEGGSTFLVMPRIPGADVGDITKRHEGPLLYEEVFDWTNQLLDILEYLQSQEPIIIHRDINPKNIRVTPDNRIFLLDFGIAKRIDLKTFLVGGTPRYAPPEQLKDEGTDTRSDIYALAATLYYLLTATEPPDALSRESAILKGSPDPLREACELNIKVPPLISQVLSRSLSLNRDRRPTNAAAMRQWLKEASEGSYCGDDVTVVSPNHKDDSETTYVSHRESVRVTIPFDISQREDSTQDALQLIRELERINIQPGLIQVLIELMDSPPEDRKAILGRYSNLIRKNQRSKSNTAIAIINKLASNTYIEPEISKNLRDKLGRLMADHTLSKMSSNVVGQSTGNHMNDDQHQVANTTHKHIAYKKWLREFGVWATRGALGVVLLQLILVIVISGQTIIGLLTTNNMRIVWVLHLILIIFAVALTDRINKIRDATSYGVGNNAIYYPLAFFFGVFLGVMLFYDFMWLIGLA